MEELAANPAFRTYAVCAAVLVLKMAFSAIYTGSRRQAHQGYINSEDATVFGKAGAAAAATESAEVAHALRIQRNDLENIPGFLVIALIYVLSGASATGAAIYFWTFTIARIIHTIVYMKHLQPWRAISFGVAGLCTVGMCVQILLGI